MSQKDKNIELIINKLTENHRQNKEKLSAAYRRIWEIAGQTHEIQCIDVNQEWKKFKMVVSKQTPEFVMVRMPLYTTSLFRYAAAIIVFLCLSAGVYLLIQPTERQQYVAGNAPQMITTPDGSQIALNAGSTLRYTGRHGHGQRKVKLSGEGYFDVYQDKTRIFIVEAGDLRVEVTGTSFFVSNNAANSSTEVIVESGRVIVYRNNDSRSSAVVLAAGEKAVYSKAEHCISKGSNSDLNYMSWKTQRLVFNDVVLSEAIKDINSLYQSEIIISSESIKNCRITATFEHQSLEAVLNIIRSTLSVEIMKKKDGRFEITGAGC